MRYIIIALILSSLAYGQTLTTVSATITDAGGQTWNNGTVTANFYPTPNNPGPFTNGGHAIQGGGLVQGSLNGSGAFSLSLDSNTSVAPANSAWTFTVCPNASFRCITSGPITITGSTQSLTSILSALAPAITVNPTPPSYTAYSDTEVSCGFGCLYIRQTDQTLRFCNVLTGCSGTGFSTFNSVPWGTPGAIGSTTPSTAAFTTLSSNGTTTLGPTTATSFNGPLNGTVGASSPNTGAFTSLNANGNSATGNVAIKNNTADNIIYVTSSGNDSNDGLSWGTAKASISGALTALPNCTLYSASATASSGSIGNVTFKCGDIYLRPGSYAGGFTINTPLVMIHGPQRGTAKIACLTNSPCVKWDPFTGGTTFFSQFDPTLRYGMVDMQLDGNGVTSNQIGLQCIDCLAITLDHTVFSDFNSTGGVGIDEEIDPNSPSEGSFAESQQWFHVTFSNNTTNLLFNNPTSTTGFGTFDYSRFHDLVFLMWAGQTAISYTNYAHCNHCEISGDTHAEGTISGETIWNVTGNAQTSGFLDISVDQGCGSGVTCLSLGGSAQFSAGTQHGSGTFFLNMLEAPLPSLFNASGVDQCAPSSASHGLVCAFNDDVDALMARTYNSNGGNGFAGLFQTKRAVTGCSTGSSIGSNCASPVTISWGTAFPDGNYTVTCTGNAPTNVPSAPYIVSGSKTSSQVQINYFAITAAAASYSTVECVGTHD